MCQNVYYQLHRLEKLIAERPTCVHEPASAYGLKENYESIMKEVECAKENLIEKVLTFRDETQLQLYVQFHQQRLIKLLDEVFLSEGAGPMSGGGQHSLPHRYKILEDLLAFIEVHFARYFDTSSKVPSGLIYDTQKVLARIVLSLDTSLNDTGADPLLVKVLLDPIKRVLMLESTTAKISYSRLSYIGRIHKELSNVFERMDSASSINDELRLVLLSINFNSRKSRAYFIQYIDRELGTVETRIEKIEILSLLLKQVNQVPVARGVGYHEHLASLKSQVKNYVAAELAYRERFKEHCPDRNATVLLPTLGDFRIKFELSVPQLAFLVRLLLKVGVISNENVSELLRFIARHSVTKRSEEISVGSLRTKFYEVESATMDSVKRLLLQATNAIGRNP
jgi:hypothetical protein